MSTTPSDTNVGWRGRFLPLRVVYGFALLLLTLAAAAASSPSPLPRGGDNPALQRFGRSVVFYVGFDGHALAEITSGDPVPRGNTNWNAAVTRGTVAFEPGVCGQGMVAHDYELDYACTGAVLRASGTVAMWLKPGVLHHTGTYCWPARLHADHSDYNVMFGRMGDPLNREALYAYISHGKAGVSSVLGSMADWKPGAWHLLVMTWDRSGLEFSVDGAPPVRSALKDPIEEGDAGGFHLTLLSPNEDTFTYDELLVLNLPLGAADIRWLFEQGAGAARK